MERDRFRRIEGRGIFHFSVPYTYGIRSRDATVELRNASGSIRHVIVDAQGKILKSKGVAHPAVIKPYLTENGCMNNIVRYMADFEERDGRFLMLWEIQPDGRYWEDEDGFGGEPDYEIRQREGSVWQTEI